MLSDYFTDRVNNGPWVTSYTLNELRKLDVNTEFVLPICSLGTPYREIGRLGEFVLPPLFHEALDESLKKRIISQIRQCFPKHKPAAQDADATEAVRVVEMPRSQSSPSESPNVLAFSVDTAVEEHGPHLPLATDTIQSYGALNQLSTEIDGLAVGPPVEYGQLTWGLPFGFSVDLTAALLTEYVARFTDAVVDWQKPRSIYVVDVHGSIVHRQAIVEGLRRSRFEQWGFRWLHEPLVEFAADRNDQHAGGVETAIVEHINPHLLDASWWPDRLEELIDTQMSFQKAVELTPDLAQFVQHVETCSLNGIIGDIGNYRSVDGELMFGRMLDIARRDVAKLLAGDLADLQGGGESHW